jgi:hypothetical protein
MACRAAVAAALFAGAASAAEITVYKQPNFTGGELTLRADTPNLMGAGFQDQVSSMQVRSGRWQVCTQPDFKGDCAIVGPGEYRTLEQALNHRIESLREVGGDNRYAENRYRDNPDYGMRRRYWRNGTVELFDESGFRGRALRVDEDVDSLADNLGSGPSSIVIHEGRWQLCSRPSYEGFCRVLEPGRYPDLGRFGANAGSMRRIG